jgi:hypothetical protein
VNNAEENISTQELDNNRRVRRFQNMELHDFLSSASVINVIKSLWVRWLQHVAHIKAMKWVQTSGEA